MISEYLTVKRGISIFACAGTVPQA